MSNTFAYHSDVDPFTSTTMKLPIHLFSPPLFSHFLSSLTFSLPSPRLTLTFFLSPPHPPSPSLVPSPSLSLWPFLPPSHPHRPLAPHGPPSTCTRNVQKVPWSRNIPWRHPPNRWWVLHLPTLYLSSLLRSFIYSFAPATSLVAYLLSLLIEHWTEPPKPSSLLIF